MFYNKFWTEQKLVVINKAQTKFTNSFIKSTTITTSLTILFVALFTIPQCVELPHL